MMPTVAPRAAYAIPCPSIRTTCMPSCASNRSRTMCSRSNPPRTGLNFSSFRPRLIAVPVEGLLDVFQTEKLTGHCSTAAVANLCSVSRQLTGRKTPEEGLHFFRERHRSSLLRSTVSAFSDRPTQRTFKVQTNPLRLGLYPTMLHPIMRPAWWLWRATVTGSMPSRHCITDNPSTFKVDVRTRSSLP